MTSLRHGQLTSTKMYFGVVKWSIFELIIRINYMEDHKRAGGTTNVENIYGSQVILDLRQEDEAENEQQKPLLQEEVDNFLKDLNRVRGFLEGTTISQERRNERFVNDYLEQFGVEKDQPTLTIPIHNKQGNFLYNIEIDLRGDSDNFLKQKFVDQDGNELNEVEKVLCNVS